MKSFKIEKLIRDKIADIMRAKGIIVHEREMSQKEWISKLKEKLIEEAREVKRSENVDDLTEELADLLEVLQSLSAASGLTMEAIEKARIKKREMFGGFEVKNFSHRIDVEEAHPDITRYLNRPLEYSQIANHQENPHCIFCQMARGEREITMFAKFQHCYVIKDQFPVSPGHALIIPYEHTDNWFTANEEVQMDILKALHLVKVQLDLENAPQGYNIGANCGEAAGQTVMHLHVHLIPRYHGDMENPRGGVRGVIPSKQKY